MSLTARDLGTTGTEETLTVLMFTVEIVFIIAFCQKANTLSSKMKVVYMWSFPSVDGQS